MTRYSRLQSRSRDILLLSLYEKRLSVKRLKYMCVREEFVLKCLQSGPTISTFSARSSFARATSAVLIVSVNFVAHCASGCNAFAFCLYLTETRFLFYLSNVGRRSRAEAENLLLSSYRCNGADENDKQTNVTSPCTIMKQQR